MGLSFTMFLSWKKQEKNQRFDMLVRAWFIVTPRFLIDDLSVEVRDPSPSIIGTRLGGAEISISALAALKCKKLSAIQFFL